MHLYPPEFQIAEDEGFSPEKDIFGRKEFGDRLTQLISVLEDPVVLLLDGELGKSSDKSTTKANKPPANSGGGSQRPLVFVIDELDRCRPPFALELLERIKHFFSVQGVVFVLVSSLEQLETAVRFAYGNLDARTYLEKFYHLRLLFPAGRLDRPNMSVGKYLGYLLQEIPPGSSDYGFILQKFASVRALSFRTLERIHAYLKLATISMPERSFFAPQIIAVLCALKVIAPEIYAAARAKTLTFSELDSIFHFSSWRDPEDPNNRVGSNVADHWRYVLGELKDDKSKAEFDSRFYSFSHPSNAVTHYCDMIDCFALPST